MYQEEARIIEKFVEYRNYRNYILSFENDKIVFFPLLKYMHYVERLPISACFCTAF